MILVCPFSNWLIAKAKSLISSDRISIEVFLVRFGLCVRMICCLFDQFFIHHIDGKYRSATALLVPLLLGSTSFHHQLKAYACTNNYKDFWPWKQKQNGWDTTDKLRTFAFFAKIFLLWTCVQIWVIEMETLKPLFSLCVTPHSFQKTRVSIVCNSPTCKRIIENWEMKTPNLPFFIPPFRTEIQRIRKISESETKNSNIFFFFIKKVGKNYAIVTLESPILLA